MEHSIWAWVGFIGLVVTLLAIDLGVLNRKDHVIRPKEALRWVALWVTLALAFGGVIWARMGGDAALLYLTGYVIEESLSVDNMFVFVVIFGALGIPAVFQHRVLFWGILSALVLRGAMIAGGIGLIHRFHWIIYVFGGFLVFTGAKLLFAREIEPHPERSAAFRFLRRVIPATSRFDGHAFFTRENGKLLATPLLFALAAIELTDIVFAVDSIPAVLAVTTDPFLVFTSNVFAILGLRSLYFVLAAFVDAFKYLKPALATVLVFVGLKMSATDVVKVHPAVSLGVVVSILALGVGASIVHARRNPHLAVKEAQKDGAPTAPSRA